MKFDPNAEGYKVLNRYCKRLRLERVQVYERLKRVEGIEKIYMIAGISVDDKEKKLKVAESIWNDSESKKLSMKPEDSVQIWDLLFPELREKMNMDLIMPSNYSLTRLRVDEPDEIPIPLSLEGTSMDFDYNIDHQIIRSLADVSRCFLSGVQQLAKSYGMNQTYVSTSRNRQLEAMDMPRHSLIHRFLNSPR